MLISEVDAMLYKFNMNPTDRIALKQMLFKRGIMEESYTPLEIPWPLYMHGYERGR